jgi:polyphosphate kinase 2 (PPK2 family)
LQTASIIAALPFTVVKIAIMISLVKDLRKDFSRRQVSIARSMEYIMTFLSLENDPDYIGLQTELIALQRWIIDNRKRLLIIFEGRDTAGKGGAIMRFVRYINPRYYRIVALPKPTEIETGQWYFQRYVREFPNPGEIVLFDRSWYNRAVVEPVMGFCSPEQYQLFLS